MDDGTVEIETIKNVIDVPGVEGREGGRRGLMQHDSVYKSVHVYMYTSDEKLPQIFASSGTLSEKRNSLNVVIAMSIILFLFSFYVTATQN